MRSESSSPVSTVHLQDYDNSWYRCGRSKLWQILWFFLGLPLLRSSLIPSSGFRTRLLRFFGAEIGPGVVLKPGIRVKYPWLLKIGAHSWIGEDAWIDNLVEVRIGQDVCVSQGVYFCTGNHDWSDPRFSLKVQPITLEDGSWAGAKAVLLPGVTMGINSIAVAGSIVGRSIPANEVHRGNPASFVKRRQIRSSTREITNSVVLPFEPVGRSTAGPQRANEDRSLHTTRVPGRPEAV
jgi:putative colanic acid biosynthesis acetyltransferase WcaF